MIDMIGCHYHRSRLVTTSRQRQLEKTYKDLLRLRFLHQVQQTVVIFETRMSLHGFAAASYRSQWCFGVLLTLPVGFHKGEAALGQGGISFQADPI